MAEVSSDDLRCRPEIRVTPPPPTTLEAPVMTLEDFVACYPMPQRAKVICGYWEASADGCDDSSREFAADEIIHLAQVVCPFVHLLVDDPASGRTVGISLSIGFQGARFRIVSHREFVGSKTPRVFQTVREMVAVFPHTVKALAGHRNAPEEEKLFGNGDRLRLVRVISLPDGGKALECKLLRGNMRLLQLPIDYEGHFAEVDDPKGYTLHELVSIARVPRTLKICPDAAQTIIPGIPENFSGCITLEKPQLFVHIERVQHLEGGGGGRGGGEADGKPFLVPVDCPIDISLREETYQTSEFGSQTPKDLMKKYGSSTPFVARVTDWFEETSILHQHLIRPGHELVFIREEPRSSVLVRDKARRRHFLVPVDHTGSFFRLNHIREDCGIPKRTPIELKSLENASFPFDAVCAKDDNPYSNLPEDVLPMDTTLTFEAFVKDDANAVVAKLADGIICRCFHLPTRTGLCLQFERRWNSNCQAEAFRQRWSDRDCLAEEISGTVYNEFMKLYSDYEWFPAEVNPCAVNKPVLEDRGITSRQNGAQKPPKDPKLPSNDYLKPDVLPPTLRPRARIADTPAGKGGSTPNTKRRAIPPPPTAPRSSPPPVPSREARSPCRLTPRHSPEGPRRRHGGGATKDPEAAAAPQPKPVPQPPPQPPPRPALASPPQASPVLPPKQRRDSNDGGRRDEEDEDQGDSDAQSYSYIDVRTLEDCVQYRKKKFPGNVATDGVSIPSDGNVSNFSADQMLLFLREVHAPMGTINAWSRMRVNGRDFAKMTDERLDEFCIQSIVVQFFRDRSRMHVLSQL